MLDIFDDEEDLYIKKLIEGYQKEGKNYEELVEKLSTLVYSYPKKVFRYNDDVCSEFYLYLFARFDKIILKYSIKEYKFTTWLISVLRFSFLNFLKKQNRKGRITPIEVDLDQEIMDDNNESMLSEGKDFNVSYYRGGSNVNRKLFDEIKDIINSFPTKLKLVMKLHYFDFFENEDILEINRVFKRDLSLLLNEFDFILDKALQKKDKIKVLFDKINTIYFEINSFRERKYRLEKNLSNEGSVENLSNKKYKDNKSIKESIEKLDKTINEQIKRQKKLINEFYSSYASISNTDIANYIGLSPNAVSNLIFRGKALLKEKIISKNILNLGE